MPYNQLSELPEAVRKLSKEKQRLWMDVWNRTYAKYGDEERAFRTAWMVVNNIKGGMQTAEWDTAYINDLPDSAFAYIEPCYKRGDTENKNARHLPYKNKEGEVDLPHLRNALARLTQIKPVCPDTDRETMIQEARRVLEKARDKYLKSELRTEYQEVFSADAVTIRGRLIQIDELNQNGWGVRSEDVNLDDFIGKPIRACSNRTDKHACDMEGDMESIIGRITKAEIEDGWIVVEAKITDSVAARKIQEGTWIPKWSVFGTGVIGEDGFVSEFKPEAVSLVENPAYKEAKFDVKSEKNLGGVNLDKEVETIKAKLEKVQEEKDALEAQNLDREIETIKSELKRVQKEKDELKARYEEKIKEYETKLAEMIPASKVEEMIKAEIAKAQEEERLRIRKADLIDGIIAAQVEIGTLKAEEIEEKSKVLAEMSVEALEEQKRILDTVAEKLDVDKYEKTDLPAETKEPEPSVGVYNHATGKWEVE